MDLPDEPHHLAKRHFYICGGQTLSWRPEWYTQPWFTSERAHYDSLASLGPVSPPVGIITTVPACEAALNNAELISSRLAEVTRTASLETLTTTIATERTSRGVAVATTSTSVFTSLVPTSTPPPSASLSIGSSLGGSSTSSDGFGSNSFPSSSALASSTSASPALGAGQVASTNTCAGDMDWQGWGVVASLGVAFIVGALLWGLWGGLRKSMPGIYAPRTWFVPPDARPSRPWSFVRFLLPFLHIPSLSSSIALSEGQQSLHTMFAALKLASIAGLLALAGGLPLIIAGVPCLSETAPPNTLGGRLGTLTDLSILRLLNALDPSPGSIQTSNLLHLPPYSRSPQASRITLLYDRIHPRALMSTIAPAISSARVRLIILLVLIALFSCFGGLFVVARLYAAFARYRKRFEEEICGGLDMVVIPAKNVPGWKGWSEEGLKKWLRERLNGVAEKDGKKVLDVMGLFAIPDTSEWRHKIEERDKVLNKLEVAEANYIKSFHLVPTSSNGRRLEYVEPHTAKDYVAPRDYYKLSSGRRPSGSHEHLNVPIPDTPPVEPPKSRNPLSRFVEVNRDSSLFSKRFSIGQRIKVNEEGQYVPDPSPESENANPLRSSTSLDGHGAASGSSHEGDTVPEPLPSPGLLAPRPPLSGHATDSSGGTQSSGINVTPRPSDDAAPPQLQAGPSRRIDIQDAPVLHTGAERRTEVMQLPTAAVVSSQRPSHEQTSPMGQNYHEIREARARLISLNGEIMLHQEQTFNRLSKGDEVLGWVIIGRGARWLPFAYLIEGRTKEDILWDYVGQKPGETVFWIKVVLVGVVLALIFVPFLGLTVATAPGFAHYLGFLKPLARSDGFGSGVEEGLAPALALILATALAVFATHRFAQQVKLVSRTQRQILAFKATFYLLLSVTIFWLITVAALQFGLQSFVLDVQSARFVADGAVFSTWFVFIVLLNMAIIVPALYLVQPTRLWQYVRSRRRTTTPRQRFRRNTPSSFTPAYAFLPFLIAVFYAFSLIFIFPLLALPLLLLAFLSFVAGRYMVDHVFVDNHGYTAASLGLWILARFGLLLSLQPFLFGLLLLSRRERAIGGVSLGVALATILLVSGFTFLRYPPRKRKDLPASTRQTLEELRKAMSHPSADIERRSHRISDSSMLQRLALLLPGYTRLHPDCPLPLPTGGIDDTIYTEKASYTRPDLAKEDDHSRQYFHDPSEGTKGLVYPPGMLAPKPVIWLERDESGIADGEAADLQKHHDLPAIVDPPRSNERRKSKETYEKESKGKSWGFWKRKEQGTDVTASSPLLR